MMAISSRSPAKSKVQERIVEDFLYVDNAALLFLQISGTLRLIKSVPAVWAHHQSEEDCSALFRCRARIFHQWCTPWELWQMFGPGIHRGLQERSVRFGKAAAVFGKLEKNISRSMLNSECTRHACWVTYFTALRRGTRTEDRQTNSTSSYKITFALKNAEYAEGSSAYLYTMGQPQMRRKVQWKGKHFRWGKQHVTQQLRLLLPTS